LRVEELTSDELVTAQHTRRAHPRLSLPDAYAYALASRRGWTLLTGDSELRALAQAERMPFFGVLWVCDQLFSGEIIPADAVAEGLRLISVHPRCRLPRADVDARLERYRRRKS
jgi:hypothetical protein